MAGEGPLDMDAEAPRFALISRGCAWYAWGVGSLGSLHLHRLSVACHAVTKKT